MKLQEFMIFSAALKTYYPRENLLPNKQAMELWFEQLQDLPYNLTAAILKQWVSINKWSPTIADIREQASEIIHGKIQTADEAWASVEKAVYNNFKIIEGKIIRLNREKELDPVTIKTLNEMEMGGFEEIRHRLALSLPEKQQQIKNLFIKTYNRIAAAETKRRQTPETIQSEIDKFKQLKIQEREA